MTSFITGSGFQSEYVRLTNSSATDVLVADSATTVASMQFTERAGTTPNLTIAVYDGTNTYYFRNAYPMTANQTVTFNEPFWVPNGWKVRVTSSHASGNVDVIISFFSPNAAQRTS